MGQSALALMKKHRKNIENLLGREMTKAELKRLQKQALKLKAAIDELGELIAKEPTMKLKVK